MPRLKLKEIYLRNWNYVTEDSVTFPEHGHVVVTGQNKISHGAASSIGSGKSSLGLALSRTLFETGSSSIIPFSKKGKGDTYVKIVCELNGSPLIVESGYKCKEINSKSEGLRYTYNGVQVQRNSVQNTREELTGLLGVSTELAEWVIMVDGEALNFESLSQQNSMSLFTQCLKLPDYSDRFRAAKETHSALVEDRSRTQGSIDSLTGQQTRLQGLILNLEEKIQDEAVRVREAERNLVSEKKRLVSQSAVAQAEWEEAKKRQKEIGAAMKKVEQEEAEEHAEEDRKRMSALSSRRILTDQLDSVMDDIRGTKSAISALEDSLKEKSCHSCKQKLPKLDPKASTKAVKDIAELQSALSALTEARDAATTAIEKLIVPTRKPSAGKKIADLSREYQTYEKQASVASGSYRDIEQELKSLVVASRVPELNQTLIERQRALEALEEERQGHVDSLSQSESAIAVADYWRIAYSPNGIPNLALRSSISHLNSVSMGIANRMTGGLIKVVYSAKKTLASGQERSVMNVTVENAYGADSHKCSSKGEKGMINLFVSETLAQLYLSNTLVGYKWYDEVLTKQDTVVKAKIWGYLREMAQRDKLLVFSVDHDPEAANHADYTLCATKTAKGTTYAWA